MQSKNRKKTMPPLPSQALTGGAWLGLIVDDDESSRASARLALDGEVVFGRPIALEFAASAEEAREKLSINNAFVFAIIDVVMEAQDSGLELIDWIRSRGELSTLRLAIRTGYAGNDEPNEMIQKYDILDFRDKSDLTRAKLGVVASLARSWMEIQSAMAGERAMGELARGTQDLNEAQSPSMFVDALRRSGNAALGPWGSFEANLRVEEGMPKQGSETIKGASLPDIDVMWDGTGAWPAQCVAVRRLMASARAAYANLAEVKKLEAMAYADPVTGLANRRRLVQWMESDGERGEALGVMILDVDHFKRVNDRLGHDAGDKLLKALGERMALACQNARARAARLGGDEFCVLFRASSAELSKEMAEAWLALIVGPVPLGFEVLEPQFSAGLAWAKGVAPGEALRNADVAMYQAKKSGRARLCVFDPLTSMDAPRRERQQRLADGVAGGEMVAMFQPMVDASSGQCVAFEMFARWRQSDKALISAGDFLPMAHEAGVSRALDSWMSAEAVRASETLGKRTQIRLNVDSKQVCGEGFAEELVQAWDNARPGAFAVEIMESSALPDVERARKFAARVSSSGHEVCLDNFGSGSASMGVLSKLALGSVKIDAALARASEGSVERMLGRSACQVASIHGLRAMASGVMSAQEAVALASWGASALQGQAIGEPMERLEAEAWLERWEQTGRVAWLDQLKQV